MKIKVSVIVPVYNTEEYLKRCLNSLVNQSLKELEIIIVNDGTKDNSQEIIDDFKNKFSNIKAYKKENGGLSSARNYGIEKATGEYLGFVDSDDYVDYDMFEKMYNKASETYSDVVCCEVINKYPFKVIKKYFQNANCFGKSVIEDPTLLFEARSYAVNKIYKRYLFDTLKFPNQWFEDSAVIYNVLYLANKVECVNLPLYYYQKEREGAITATINEKIYDIFKSCDSIINFYSQKKDYDKLKTAVEALCIKHLRIRLFYIYNCKNKKLTWKFFNDVRKYLNENFSNWRKNIYLSNKHKSKKDRFKNNILKSSVLFKICTIMPTTLFIKISSILSKVNKKIKMFIKNRNKKNIDKKRKIIQENGCTILQKIKMVLDKEQIINFADFGTLLGLVREKSLLKHDVDIDTAVIVNDEDIDKVTTILERQGFRMWREYIYNNRVVERSFHYNNMKIDMNFYVNTSSNSKTWLFYRKNKYINKNNSRDVVEMSYSKITSTKTINIKDNLINIPSNYETILKEKYGDNWRTPDTGWTYWESPVTKKVEEKGYFVEYKYQKENE